MFVLAVDGDMITTQDFDDDSTALRFENADDTAWRCTACGARLIEDGDGVADESGRVECVAYDPDDDPDHDGDTGPEAGEGPHRAERVALSWANSAAIHTDPGEDSITVTISVGDPRGALAFSVRRIPDDADTNAGRLILHTPYPGEPMPHVDLTEDHTGTYWVS
ncbi:hypothetical protein GIY23_12895 [Allosaccharopolyspora coralli]|uniref:Uncharacterized protein n=1 Tax=Allosaccharopolyspora coralli TaxID=2665642 RepID=A0A5Q3Q750_9PSEU|nr:hypothetical protein [Allosaccharopolyspora coralli]QGK70302.1 hypothetical protein GIY23_12895 [Allosaccharopolyspora coralli]